MRSIVLLFAGAVLCVGLALFVPRSQATPMVEASDVRAWEYKVIDIESLIEIRGLGREDRDKMAAELEAGLNRLGAEGWEFAFEMRGPMVFKRPK